MEKTDDRIDLWAAYQEAVAEHKKTIVAQELTNKIFDLAAALYDQKHLDSIGLAAFTEIIVIARKAEEKVANDVNTKWQAWLKASTTPPT